jgi:hypothetical protein
LSCCWFMMGIVRFETNILLEKRNVGTLAGKKWLCFWSGFPGIRTVQ